MKNKMNKLVMEVSEYLWVVERSMDNVLLIFQYLSLFLYGEH